MMIFPRAPMRAFRAIARKGGTVRSREPAPPVVLIPESGAVTFLVHRPTVAIALRVSTDQPGSDSMVVPGAALDAVDGPGNDTVTVESMGKLRAELCWTDRGTPRTQPVELERFTPAHACPTVPTTFAPMPPELLAALHEAGRTSGGSTGRYALDRVQVKGRTGAVAASDGHLAYLHGGFRFPFKEDCLVPALPLFGTAELRNEPDVAIGRTDTHLVLRLGPWTIWLSLDVTGSFPDVAGIVPKAASAVAVLVLDEADAAELLAALPKLPGAKDDRQPVTLDLAVGQPAMVRAWSAEDSKVAEVRLDRSTVTKGTVRVAVDRTFLDRAIRLGCRSVFAHSSERPVVARKGPVILLAGALDSSLIVQAPAATEPEATSALVLSSPAVPERSPPMVIAPLSVPSSALTPVESPPAIDPLAEAEALRVVCVEAGQRLGRLVEWFQARRKEPRVMARVWSALQSLKLRP